jgi:hypothetical protein
MEQLDGSGRQHLRTKQKKNQPRPAGKLIIADICKGIFVISQAT